MLNFQQITMPYLAALVPPGWDVTHVDEAVEPVDISAQVDLVGITFHTPSAAHVYALAAEFRRRGVAVALGGPHVSLVPDEAQQHADAIFVGEAELHWPRFLRAFARGQHQPRYVSTEAPSLDDAPMARKDLYHRHDLTAGRLFATRGCAYSCEFCAVAVMYPHPVRKRPVAAVAAEYASFPGKVIIFWDDNLANDREYAKDLFRLIAPHHKWWSSQVSIQAAQDPGFLEAAARSGCKQLFIGLESVCQESMNEVHKGLTASSNTRAWSSASTRTASPCRPASCSDSTTTPKRSSQIPWISWNRPAWTTPLSTCSHPTRARLCSTAWMQKAASSAAIGAGTTGASMSYSSRAT